MTPSYMDGRRKGISPVMERKTKWVRALLTEIFLLKVFCAHYMIIKHFGHSEYKKIKKMRERWRDKKQKNQWKKKSIWARKLFVPCFEMCLSPDTQRTLSALFLSLSLAHTQFNSPFPHSCLFYISIRRIYIFFSLAGERLCSVLSVAGIVS